MAKNGPLSRLIAAALLSVPLSWTFTRYEHAKLDRWLTQASVEQTRYVHLLQWVSFGRAFVVFLVVTSMLVLAIEGIAYFLRGRGGDGGAGRAV